MLIVPLSGDTIKTAEGLPYKVLSFSNYNPEGPSVIVENQGKTETVDFRDIVQVGKSKVHLLKNAKGSKVFSADGHVQRRYHLPQPGDTVKAKTSVGTEEFIIVKLSLAVKGQLTNGLLIDAKNKNTGDSIQLVLGQITDIEQTIFSRSDFLKYYADYREKGTQAPQEVKSK